MASDDRRRLDMVIYGVTPWGGALCCDATLVLAVSRDGQPQGHSADENGAALATATRHKEACLFYSVRRLGAAGACWGTGAIGSRSPSPVARPSRCAQCRGYRLGSALVDSAVGRCSACDSLSAASRASADASALELVLALADAAGPSTLPLRRWE
eukprot:s2421_g4.t1